jgi:YHS domain-containing protein
MFGLFSRIFDIIIAVSVVLTVLRYLRALFSGRITRQSVSKPPAADQQTSILRQDPVCGTYVAIDASFKKIVDGKVIHFCSDECRDKYAQSPH